MSTREVEVPQHGPLALPAIGVVPSLMLCQDLRHRLPFRNRLLNFPNAAKSAMLHLVQDGNAKGLHPVFGGCNPRQGLVIGGCRFVPFRKQLEVS